MGKYSRRFVQKDFEHQLLDAGKLPNIISGLCTATYLFVFSGIPFGTMEKTLTAKIIASLVIVLFLLQFALAPFTNHILINPIHEELKNWQRIDKKKRTTLVRNLMTLPARIALKVFAILFVGELLWLFGIQFALYSMSGGTFLFCLLTFFTGAYTTSLLAFGYSNRICSSYSKQIIKLGVDSEIVQKDKYYGPGYFLSIFLYIIIPFFEINTLQILFLYQLNSSQTRFAGSSRAETITLLCMILCNFIICAGNAFFFFFQNEKSLRLINSVLKTITSGSSVPGTYLPTDLRSELAYTIFIINNIMSYLQSIIVDIGHTSTNLLRATQELSVTSKQMEDTSYVQAESVKECLAIMDNTKELLTKINSHGSSVAEDAEFTLNSINEGSKLLQKNNNKMLEITNANLETITGIKMLSEKIETVWNIINTIDSIAARTRTIAFNAEIEAASVGDGGENFHIVANEIRRLASTITDSTRDIRERITGIQHSSDNLIITSEGGTEKIREESELLFNLKEKIDKLKISSEVTAESATEIQNIAGMQDSGFVQIKSTLKQLSEGFAQFTMSATTISTSVQSIQETAMELITLQNNGGAADV